MTIPLHIAYWVCYALLQALILILMVGNREMTTLDMLGLGRAVLYFTMIPAVLCFYGFYAWVAPRLERRQWWPLAGIALSILVLSGIATMMVGSLLIDGTLLSVHDRDGFFEVLLVLCTLGGIHGVLALIVKGFLAWYRELRWKEELQAKNFEMEMALVKAQLDPHFLFNTLNNIDVLIEKDPARASAYLNKLSAIMRFMLYETKADRIDLARELEYVERYLDLQRIRHAHSDYVQFSIQGAPTGQRVAPMLLLPFLENAFKHAVRNPAKDADPTAIHIHLDILPESLRFRCQNRFKPDAQASEEGGLGHALIAKRLALLYPGKHQLNTLVEGDVYQVALDITFN